LASFAPVTRMLHDNVSEWYGALLVLYKLAIGFAVIRVISGVFLHETFKCAQMDDDLMIKNRERTKRRFRQKMTGLFAAADTSGDGLLSKEEFVEIVRDDKVAMWLQAMDLWVRNPNHLFEYLAGDKHELKMQELVKGVAKLKGPALALDAVSLHSDARIAQREQHKAVRKQNAQMKQLRDELGYGLLAMSNAIAGLAVAVGQIEAQQDFALCEESEAHVQHMHSLFGQSAAVFCQSTGRYFGKSDSI